MGIRELSQFALATAFDGMELQFLCATPRAKYSTDPAAAFVQDTRTIDGREIPVYDVELLAKDAEGGYSSLTVRVATFTEPQLGIMTTVRLHNAFGTSWKMASGSGGFSIRADGIEAVSNQRVAPSAADDKKTLAA